MDISVDLKWVFESPLSGISEAFKLVLYADLYKGSPIETLNGLFLDPLKGSYRGIYRAFTYILKESL